GPIPSVPVFFVLSGPRVHRALRSFPTRRSSDLMRKCYEDGISIPRDLSVVGFDDIRLAQFMLPPLTTVQMSQAELARLAFDALLAEVEREEPLPEGSEYVLKTALIERESTAICRECAREPQSD